MAARLTGLCPFVTYRDVTAASTLVQALGFEPVATLVDDDSVIVHVEWAWPGGGGVVIGPAREGGSAFEALPPGTAGLYVVTDDVDAVWERATAAGVQVVHPIEETGFRVRGFTVRDHEGNLWSFGTHYGLPRHA